MQLGAGTSLFCLSQYAIPFCTLSTHEGITIKALLDSSATGMFMDRRMAAKHSFRLQKLKRPIAVDGGSKGIDHRTRVVTNEKVNDPRDVSQLCANK